MQYDSGMEYQLSIFLLLPRTFGRIMINSLNIMISKSFLFVFIFFLVHQNCISQKIVFQLERIGFCSKKVSKVSAEYYLTKVGAKKYVRFECKNGSVILPEPGKYLLRFYLDPWMEIPVIDIPNVKKFVYKFPDPKIIWHVYGTDGYGLYEVCGVLAEGYQEDYFDNRKLSLRGNFSKGEIKDSLVEFYPSGGIKKRIKYLPKQVYVEEYDSLSRLHSVTYSGYGNIEYRDKYQVDYFTNGKILRITELTDHFYLVKEYYLNGQMKINQTKDDRIDFYENGAKRNVYNWVSKKEDSIMDEQNYSVTTTKNSFDINGQLIESVVYEVWRQSRPQPIFQIYESDWIVKWSKFYMGKEKVVAKDVDTKDFFRKRGK